MTLRSCCQLLVALVSFGCSAASDTTRDGEMPPTSPDTTNPVATAPCTRDATNDEACLPAASDQCPAGTMAVLGTNTCEPVGVATCAAPFRRDASGFGCDPALPTECSEGSRIAPGGCVPVGDCNAPFPPAGASIVVDPTGPNDATHKKTIAAAIQAIAEGGTIAVAAGTYAESLSIAKSVAIVGRCPSLVVLEAPSGASSPGVFATGSVTASVSGMTVRGFLPGVLLDKGASLTVKDAIVDANRSIGVYAHEAASVSLENVLVRGTLQEARANGWGIGAYSGAKVAIADTTVIGSTAYGIVVSGHQTSLAARRTLVAEVRAVPDSETPTGIGMLVGSSAEASLEDSVVHDTDAVGVSVTSSATLALTRSIVSLTRSVAGTGIQMTKGGVATIADTTLAAHPRENILLVDEGTRCAVKGSAIVGPAGNVPLGRGVGVNKGAVATLSKTAILDLGAGGVDARSATVDLDRVLVRGVDPSRVSSDISIDYVEGAGIVSDERAKVTAAECTVENAHVGVLASHDGVGTFDHLLVRTILAGPTYGIGVYAAFRANVTFTASAVDRIAGMGVVATDQGTTATFVSSILSRSGVDSEGELGHGAAAVDGATLDFQNGHVVGNAGIGVAVANARGRVVGGDFVKNAIATHAQERTTVVESDGAELSDHVLSVSKATRFVDNGARVGEGNVPIPRNILDEPEK